MGGGGGGKLCFTTTNKMGGGWRGWGVASNFNLGHLSSSHSKGDAKRYHPGEGDGGATSFSPTIVRRTEDYFDYTNCFIAIERFI